MLDKGDTAKQAQQVEMRAKAVIQGCGFKNWSDIRANRVERVPSQPPERAEWARCPNFEFLLGRDEMLL